MIEQQSLCHFKGEALPFLGLCGTQNVKTLTWSDESQMSDRKGVDCLGVYK